MHTDVSLSPNPLVHYLKKTSSDFTRGDLSLHFYSPSFCIVFFSTVGIAFNGITGFD
jgi:hypothetical protein